MARLKLQLDRLHRWRDWEADAETVIELCAEEEGGGGDAETVAMLDEAVEVCSAGSVVMPPR